MILKEMKDWNFDELVLVATWKVMDCIIRGELRSGVYQAVDLALRWRMEKDAAEKAKAREQTK